MLVKKVLVLDSFDKVIIKTLLKNPRTSMTALAAICNVSDVSIKKRVDKLEKHGIIEFKVVLKSGVEIDEINVVVQIVDTSEHIHSDFINKIPE